MFKMSVLLLTLCLCLLTSIGGTLEDRGLSNTGSHMIERRKRSVQPPTTLLLQGLRATRKILAGAKKTPSDGRLNRYEKYGNINTAINDFYSLQPREIKRYRLKNGVKVISGIIGDRKISIIDDGVKGNPMIRIIDSNAKRILEKWEQPGKYGEYIVYNYKYNA